MKTVLIADDNMLSRKQLQDIFTRHMGMEVVGLAKNGNEAVELFKQHQPDLITLDITMPVKSGVAALEEILAIDPAACCVMISALKEDSDQVISALNAGAKTYISKPIKPKDETFLREFSEEEAAAPA